MDGAKATLPGVALEDVCLLYEPLTAAERMGRIMRQVAKCAANNIYTYVSIRLCLRDPQLGAAQARLSTFLGSTFYSNSEALSCTMAGLAIALIGENVDRAFWTIGAGGVGQSLFTSLIHNALAPTHGFFDCTALYLDDELRKTLEHLIPFKILTAQEGAEGGSAIIRNPRQDLYKKICPSGPISRRLPYAKSTKIVSVRGILRFELNRPLNFANIEESNWDSISRRSLVIEMKAKFPPAVEFENSPVDRRDAAGNSRKGDTLEKFLESGPAAMAFIRALYKYMNDNATEESRGEIDLYAMIDGGDVDGHSGIARPRDTETSCQSAKTTRIRPG